MSALPIGQCGSDGPHRIGIRWPNGHRNHPMGCIPESDDGTLPSSLLGTNAIIRIRWPNCHRIRARWRHRRLPSDDTIRWCAELGAGVRWWRKFRFILARKVVGRPECSKRPHTRSHCLDAPHDARTSDSQRAARQRVVAVGAAASQRAGVLAPLIDGDGADAAVCSQGGAAGWSDTREAVLRPRPRPLRHASSSGGWQTTPRGRCACPLSLAGIRVADESCLKRRHLAV